MKQPIRAKKIEPPKIIWVPTLFAALSTRQGQNNDRYISVDTIKKWIADRTDGSGCYFDGDELLKFIEEN